MRLCFVVQRFGEEIVGGSEWYARCIALKLKKTFGYDVEVLTTTAKDYTTWRPYYPEGTTEFEGIRITRFHAQWQRDMRIFNLLSRFCYPLIRALGKIKGLKVLGSFLEKIWFCYQGPYCPKLLKAIEQRKDQVDRFFFMTYLYYPTVFGLPLVKEKAALIPTAHHEPPFYFQHITALLQAPRALLLSTVPEMRLVEGRATSLPPLMIAGVGLEPIASEGIVREDRHPYILYLGRISRAKGVDQLIHHFQKFIKKTQSTVHLVLAGAKDESIPTRLLESEQVEYKGFVSEKEKYQWMAGAQVIVNPSRMESLSILVVEGMLMKKPVLVNQQCPVMNYFSEATYSVFSYRHPFEFIDVLEQILKSNWHSPQAEAALAQTQQFAKKLFSWDRVLKVYQEVITGEVSAKERSNPEPLTTLSATPDHL